MHWVTGIGSGGWLAIAAWAAVAVGVTALVWVWLQTRRHRRETTDQIRPYLAMYMEPHPADWQLIELVVRNFGRTAAYDVKFAFSRPPTVARYEDEYDDRRPDVVHLPLPKSLPMLAPGQEWRTVWDSQMDREQLGEAIESRFDGTVTYFDRVADGGRFTRKPHHYEAKVVLDWDSLQPAERLEALTDQDFSRREREKLELLRSLLTYYSYATKDNRRDVLRGEIERINRAADETVERLRNSRAYEPTTEIVDMRRWMRDEPLDEDQEALPGRHHHPN